MLYNELLSVFSDCKKLDWQLATNSEVALPYMLYIFSFLSVMEHMGLGNTVGLS